jgi:NAD(P)-dependent dehydrogenase (short-subunit alcohol dehydrogenase family)
MALVEIGDHGVMSSTPLAGQVAVVTGASRGIGRGIAVHLGRRGAVVAGMARPSDDLSSLQRAAGDGPGEILPVPADVTSATELEAAFECPQARFGPPALVVTCAGTAEVTGPGWSADADQSWQAVAVDLRGTMLTARSAIPRMLAAGSGGLVTIYGNLGDRQLGNVPAFAVAKAGIARLTESLACELAGTPVRALCVHPGFVRTPMTERLAWSEDGRRWLPGFAAGAEKRWGDAGPAAELVEAIAMGAADQLTGRILYPGDDLSALTTACQSDPDHRRLRLNLG